MVNRSKYTKEILEEAAKNCKSVAEVCRYIGTSYEGSMHTHIKKQLKKHEIDISHFLGKAAHAGKFQTGKCKRRTADEILTANKSCREKGYILRRALLDIGIKYQCYICDNNGFWRNKPLMLEVDHINDNWQDCRKENLRFLCPQCHSQKTYPNFKEP